MRKLLAATLCLIGCGTDGSSTGDELIDGFDPPAPASDEIQLISPPIRGIAPGADITMCSYLDKRIVEESDIVDYHGVQSGAGAHHAILYSVTQQQAVNTHECNEDDMVNARYLAGGGADSPAVQLPENIVFRMPANTQLMIQTHWINATDDAFDGQAAFNIKVTKPKPEHQVAQLMTVGSTSFTLAPGLGAVSASCVLQESMKVFMLGGHMHEWGRHSKITHTTAASATSTVLYDHPWSAEDQFNPPRNSYTTDNPLMLNAGDTLGVDCDFDNDTGHDLPFPREMCVAFAYAYPMTRQIDCMDGNWPRE